MEIIQFRHRCEGIQTSPEGFVPFRQRSGALLREQLPLACQGRLHFLCAFKRGDIRCNATNRVWLARTIAQQEFRRDIHPSSLKRGHGLLNLDRLTLSSPDSITCRRVLSIRSLQTECSTHSHLCLRASLSCLGFFLRPTADKFSSLILFISYPSSCVPSLQRSLLAFGPFGSFLRPPACLRYYGRSDSCPSAALRPVLPSMNSAP